MRNRRSRYDRFGSSRYYREDEMPDGIADTDTDEEIEDIVDSVIRSNHVSERSIRRGVHNIVDSLIGETEDEDAEDAEGAEDDAEDAEGAEDDADDEGVEKTERRRRFRRSRY